MPSWFFFFNDTATTEIYTLSLHDALPISTASSAGCIRSASFLSRFLMSVASASAPIPGRSAARRCARSEEHTSELQSRQYLVCRLLLEKKKQSHIHTYETFYDERVYLGGA